MWKWLIGPTLLATGCIVGSVYGRDSEQVVHESPSNTYGAVEQALNNVPKSGMTYFDGGTPMPYEIKIGRTFNEQLDVMLFFDGEEGAEAKIEFRPLAGGNETLVTTKIHGDHSVLRTALAGTKDARLAYAPDWALNLAARSLLRQIASQIEQGQMAQIAAPITEADAESQWEQNLSDEQRDAVQQYREYDATRPSTDPEAAAANYMGNPQ